MYLKSWFSLSQLEKNLKNNGQGLTLIYIGFGLEKHKEFLVGIELTLWYIGFGLEKLDLNLKNTRTTFTGLGLILWNTGLGSIN